MQPLYLNYCLIYFIFVERFGLLDTLIFLMNKGFIYIYVSLCTGFGWRSAADAKVSSDLSEAGGRSVEGQNSHR